MAGDIGDGDKGCGGIDDEDGDGRVRDGRGRSAARSSKHNEKEEIRLHGV